MHYDGNTSTSVVNGFCVLCHVLNRVISCHHGGIVNLGLKVEFVK